jgi:Uma2 family endonuclease
MIMQAEAKKIYTPEEYLELEVNSEIRNEYRDGDITPMAGGTPEHNEIASILNAALRVALKGKPYSIFVADQRLWIPERNLYTYPDVMVISRPLELQTGRTDTVMNPCFVAEVLSKSTQNYDRSEKFVAYRTIPTFREYLLIDQYRVYVEHYVQTNAHQWLFSEYDDPTVTLTLSTIDVQVQIADLYENIDFESAQ